MELWLDRELISSTAREDLLVTESLEKIARAREHGSEM